MTAYAVAHLRTVDQNAEIVDYLRRIDATLDPFGGRFVVHGALPEVLEGEWPGFLVVIGFPDLAPPGPGTTRPPTRRSCRCARATPTA